MKMKIVQFKNGKYGLRKGWHKFNYKYKDLSSSLRNSNNINGFWWSRDNMYFKDCEGTLERVKHIKSIYDGPLIDFGTILDTEKFEL